MIVWTYTTLYPIKIKWQCPLETYEYALLLCSNVLCMCVCVYDGGYYHGFQLMKTMWYIQSI